MSGVWRLHRNEGDDAVPLYGLLYMDTVKRDDYRKFGREERFKGFWIIERRMDHRRINLSQRTLTTPGGQTSRA
jgi:hypothetical protein